MILSLSLMTLVMVGLTFGISLYGQFQGRSLVGVHQTKVLRGTIEDIRDDLRACSLAEVVMEEPIAEKNWDEKVLDFDTNDNEQPIHFVGRTDALLILRNGCNSRFVDPKPSDDRLESVVVWLTPKARSIRLPVSHLGDRISYREFKSPNNTNGLHRHTTSTSSSKHQQWHANEWVESMSFRFYDASNWVDQWDSHLHSGRVPQLVEITLSLRSDPEKEFRFVVRLRGPQS